MDATPLCSNCGKPLAPDAPRGLCAECLLQAAFPTGTGTGGKVRPFQPPAVADLAPLFPQLEILALIGSGGMGAVYRARQKQLDRMVALKILPPDVGQSPSFAERFAREAKALARLSHPGIVTLYEFGRAELPLSQDAQQRVPAPHLTPDTPPLTPLYFFLMEFVDGVNLGQLLRTGRLAPKEALAIVPQICDALQYAHDRGIVHRDIKPENILLGREGQVKVADFGIAKLAERGCRSRSGDAGARDIGGSEASLAGGGAAAETAALPSITDPDKLMGTPQYMAPEQKEHPLEVDHRADIYSLGVVLYQMLTGELPAGKFEPPSSRMRGMQVDVRIDEIVLRALEKNPELRYQQASVFKTQVETMAATAPRDSSRPTAASLMNRGVDYRSKATLFGLPWVSVATGYDLTTGRKRVAKGVLAIGDVAQGVVAFGGVAMGGIAFGGVAVGVFAFGGAALGLLAFGGMGIALLAAWGGCAIAPVALGALAVGYFAKGALAVGVHVLDAATKDPSAERFFQPWANVLLQNTHMVVIPLVLLTIAVSVGAPLWVSRRGQHRPPGDRRAPVIAGGLVLFLFLLLAVMQPKMQPAADRTHRTSVGSVQRLPGDGPDEVLDLSGVRLSESDLAMIAAKTRLRRLHLSDSTISDDDLARLAELTDLEYVDLSATLRHPPFRPRITDAGLEHVARWKNLTTLNLHGNPVTDDGIKHLWHLPNLSKLQLGGTGVTGKTLGRIHSLTWLRLDATLIQDEDLRHLAGLNNLEQLYLDLTGISDAGLRHLTGLTNLLVLNVHETKVTSKGVAALKRVLPALSIGVVFPPDADAAADGNPVFGPALEVTLSDYDVQPEALDFETGRILVVPTGTEKQLQAGNPDWFVNTGVDLMTDTTRKGVGLIAMLTNELQLVKLANEEWDSTTPARLSEALSRGVSGLAEDHARKFGKVYVLQTNAPLPLTLGFRTGGGSEGVLQLIRFGEGSQPPVTLRFKLLQSTTAMSLPSNPASAAFPKEHGVSITFSDCPVSDALVNLARELKLNCVLDPQLLADWKRNPAAATVNVSWTNITAAQAFAALLDNYSLQATTNKQTSVVRVSAKGPAGQGGEKPSLQFNLKWGVEGVLTDPRQPNDARQARTYSFLDLARKRLADSPVALPPPNGESFARACFNAAWRDDLIQAARAQGLDLAGDPLGRGVVGFDLSVEAVSDNNLFADMPAEELVARLTAVGRPPAMVRLQATNAPATWMFRTREGVCGLLAIRAFHNNDTKVSVCWKIVQAGSLPFIAPAVPKPAALLQFRWIAGDRSTAPAEL